MNRVVEVDRRAWGFGFGVTTGGSLVLAVLVAAVMYGCPHYNVWQQGLAGEAELKRATQNRLIKVQDASATKEAAKLLGDAEAERAAGTARANEIIGDSLKSNEAYLRYLWIMGLQTNQMQVVYVPTEANMPLLESTRLSHMMEGPDGKRIAPTKK